MRQSDFTVGVSLYTERPGSQKDSRQPRQGARPSTTSYFDCLHLSHQDETCLHAHAGTMGTVSELCVSSLQTFLCPAVKSLQEAPGKVTTVGP